MQNTKKIRKALISVFNKDGLGEILELLSKNEIEIISTGGTKKFIEERGYKVSSVEELTSYPSILGGRVKTLHPKVFGGILSRRDSENDKNQLLQYKIPEIDLVIVDLYPFEKTIATTTNESEIIEKIDIGGISLIRAAAKNFNDVLVISAREQYAILAELLKNQQGSTTLEQRKQFAVKAFNVSSHYDTAIYNHFCQDKLDTFKQSILPSHELRYGENPHQQAKYFGNLDEIFTQLHGKKISYNNLLDIDAAVNLIADFSETTVAILKHNNACGLASRPNLTQAWKDALAGDPVSAFGGIIISNKQVDLETANEMHKLFFEVVIAPSYADDALEVLKKKKNRIILVQKAGLTQKFIYKQALNGVLVQEKDLNVETTDNYDYVTQKRPTEQEAEDLIFANKLVKHSKSNAIVLAKNKQLIASGVGETSRIDALKHAIEKAKTFGFDLKGAVLSSDAFFPFADSVETAHNEGITSVIQPGGSIKDKDSIEFCNKAGMSMVFTGFRHFKH